LFSRQVFSSGFLVRFSRQVRWSERVCHCLPVVPGVSAMGYSESLLPLATRPADGL
jgi:hypothetical protein